MISIHPIEASSVAINRGDVNGSSLYVHGLPPGVDSFNHPFGATCPGYPFVLCAGTTTSIADAADARAGTTTEVAVAVACERLPPWHSERGRLEPTRTRTLILALVCSQRGRTSMWQPRVPYTADCYGVRGMSCCTAFVIAPVPSGGVPTQRGKSRTL